MNLTKIFTFPILGLLPLLSAESGEVEVVDATAQCSGSSCSFSATLLHNDQGWDHYADHWRILAPNGEELGRRVLLHPHENEQPFTRSLSGVEMPPGLEYVIIDAHDSVHEYGGNQFKLTLPDE